MGDDQDVSRAARLLIAEFGPAAAKVAADRAVNLEGAGARMAARQWRRIAIAVSAIEIARPKLHVVR
jgi:hypothetical protein